jgi:hypothetical protein
MKKILGTVLVLVVGIMPALIAREVVRFGFWPRAHRMWPARLKKVSSRPLHRIKRHRSESITV